MRTALWLIAVAIWDLSLSVSGGESAGTGLLMTFFFVFAAMDIIEFFKD